MKKILIVASSPRKNGNSDILAAQFAKGAVEAGSSVETVFVRNLHFNYCKGCLACVKSGKCVQTDDMASVLPKMMEADAIVFASPVYYYSLSGQMKTFIDRCNPLYGRMKDKDFYFIATSADSDPKSLEKVFAAFEGFTDCFDGMNLCGRVYGVSSEKIGDVKATPAFEQAYKMGLNV